jgi:hypothetical protein
MWTVFGPNSSYLTAVYLYNQKVGIPFRIDSRMQAGVDCCQQPFHNNACIILDKGSSHHKVHILLILLVSLDECSAFCITHVKSGRSRGLWRIALNRKFSLAYFLY